MRGAGHNRPFGPQPSTRMAGDQTCPTRPHQQRMMFQQQQFMARHEFIQQPPRSFRPDEEKRVNRAAVLGDYKPRLPAPQSHDHPQPSILPRPPPYHFSRQSSDFNPVTNETPTAGGDLSGPPTPVPRQSIRVPPGSMGPYPSNNFKTHTSPIPTSLDNKFPPHSMSSTRPGPAPSTPMGSHNQHLLNLSMPPPPIMRGPLLPAPTDRDFPNNHRSGNLWQSDNLVNSGHRTDTSGPRNYSQPPPLLRSSDNAHSSDPATASSTTANSRLHGGNNPRPPLLGNPAQRSTQSGTGFVSNNRIHTGSSPIVPQNNSKNGSWSESNTRMQNQYEDHISYEKIKPALQECGRENQRSFDRRSSESGHERSSNVSLHRTASDYSLNRSPSAFSSSDRKERERSEYSKDSRALSQDMSRVSRSSSDVVLSHRDSRSNRRDQDNRSSRSGSRNADAGRSGEFQKRSETYRHPERSRSDSRNRSHSRSTSRYSESRRRSRSRDRERGDSVRGDGTGHGDRRAHPRETRDRGRAGREGSCSSSGNPSSKETRSSHTKSKLCDQRSSPSRASRDTNSRNLASRRSQSPMERAYSSQLSQYRQDLLNSEQRIKEQTGSSPRSRNLETDFNILPDYNKDEELQVDTESISYFTRSCPADLYFTRNSGTGDMEATARMVELENRFEEEIVKRAEKVRATQAVVEEAAAPPRVNHSHHHHHCSGHKSSSCDSSSESDDDDDDEDDDDNACSQIMEEWDKRKKHPYSIHPELWFNLKGQANDGPLCRCSIKSQQTGIRHDIYPGETPIEPCVEESSNLSQLHHYRITMSPYTNFLTKVPTLINHDNHEFIFEGFSMFSHVKLENIPPCKLLRFNIEYTIHFIPETAPENFTVRSLHLFNRFIFTEILELIDMDWTGPGKGCQRFHFLPRFCRTLPDSGCKEVLSMNTVLSFLLKSVKPLVEESRLEEIMSCGESEWHSMVDNLRGMIVNNPGMRPSSVRVDQLDRKVTTPIVKLNSCDESDENSREATVKKSTPDTEKSQQDSTTVPPKYPLIIHLGYRPAQLSYAGDPAYRKAWKQYVKFRHLLNSKPKILAADKVKLKEQEEKLREIRMKKTMKREMTVELSSKGFLCTGLRADLCQHALLVPVLMSHLRFHICLDILEQSLNYRFKDRNLLQLSLTHTSYRTNYGTNPDHTRNSLTNCGMRQVEYGDRRIHYQNTRKRGICILVDIMSRFGKQEETISEIPHNERLEFLGDAVIEFLTSVHLFYMFPWLDEGGLTTYRMALVQNQHLAVLARKLKLQEFMLYVHGPDLCHESDLRHAMANCCEAIMGALFLDGGLEVADRIFSRTLFGEDEVLLKTWDDLPKHVLQQEEPAGDRHWVKSSPILQKMEKFEERIGIKFNHIRILAKAFTHRNIGVNPLTLGHNQRLEFLGDTVLQLIASEYLYRHYPEHHEGHLSLLRSSLVNSRTQGLVYDDLGMSEFVICNENMTNEGLDMKTKQRADILESFVGALFVDKDLDYCRCFCNVCFFPRLKDFIMNQDWNDPKSQLQQCCLTLREVGGGEPDIPVYKVIKSIGPTNTRKYVVAVYFRGKRLARGTGHSIQQAEMAAATQALKKRAELFPILQHQRRFLERMRKEDSGRDSDRDEPSAPKVARFSRSRLKRQHDARKSRKFD